MSFKTLLLSTLIAVSLPVIGQEKSNKLDLRIGAGISFMATGDMKTFNYENEINYKLSPYFTSSASIVLGRSNYGSLETASFTQGNLNFYISPFKNNRRFDFRIGTGLTYYGISDAYQSFVKYENGVLVDLDYSFDKRNSFGCNLIIENSYLLTNRLSIGLKLFTQPYLNKDINSGLLLKLGLKI